MFKIRYIFQQLYKQWLLIFLATIGLASGLLAIFPVKQPSVLLGVIIICLCICITTIITLLNNKIEHITDEELWVLDAITEKPSVVFPYPNNYLTAANQLAYTHYGKGALPAGIIKSWYTKNPLVFTVLTNTYGKFIGYFDILPLTTEFGKEFVCGNRREKDIRSEHILEPSKMNESDFIYFAGVSVKDQDTQLGKKHAAILVYCAISYIEKFYDLTTERNIYAIAASACGRKILEKLNFIIACDESNRKDKTDMYYKTINRDDVAKLKAKLDFCKDLVNMSAYDDRMA